MKTVSHYFKCNLCIQSLNRDCSSLNVCQLLSFCYQTILHILTHCAVSVLSLIQFQVKV